VIAPLPIPPEELVIVDITDGVAITTLVHLPAIRSNGWDQGGGTFTSYDFPPAMWPSKCGAVPKGAVYLRAGPFADAVICRECLAA